MVKVYLVEDEIIIRQSIKNSIDWEKEGYEFVGDASDGELALPVILKEKPDILITDIRMPFMDGLELSRMVKAELPDIKIVMIGKLPEKVDAPSNIINVPPTGSVDELADYYSMADVLFNFSIQ